MRLHKQYIQLVTVLLLAYSFQSIALAIESPWLQPLLEPSLGVSGTYLHGSTKNTSAHASNVEVHGNIAIPYNIQSSIKLGLGQTKERIGYPKLTLKTTKQICNDIASHDRRLLALSIGVECSLNSKMRVQQAIFQEWGEASAAIGCYLGKHVIILSKDRYAQIYGMLQFGAASSGVLACTYGLKTCFSFNSRQAVEFSVLKSQGHGSVKRVLGTNTKLVLEPSFYEVLCDFKQEFLGKGRMSFSLAHRVYTKSKAFHIYSIRIGYTIPISL